VLSLECVRQAVFRATPLLQIQEKRCRACLTALLVTALQKDLDLYYFVFFVDFVVPSIEVIAKFCNQICPCQQANESQLRTDTVAVVNIPFYPTWILLSYRNCS